MAEIETIDPADLDEELPEEEQERIQFLTTGGMRVQVRGKWLRFRRPDFGELKKLHTLWDEVTADMAIVADENRRKANELGEKANALAEQAAQVIEAVRADPQDGEAQNAEAERLMAETREMLRSQHAAVREIRARQNELREQWWHEVFRTLLAGGSRKPKVLPSWVADPELVTSVLQHWMSVPLGRGQGR